MNPDSTATRFYNIINNSDKLDNIRRMYKDQNIQLPDDWILNEVHDHSLIGVDVRTIEHGYLVWYNAKYAEMIHRVGLKVKNLKTWEDIITKGKFSEEIPRYGIFDHDTYQLTDEVKEKVRSSDQIEFQYQFNAPLDKKGYIMPVKMKSIIIKDLDLIFTEFYIYDDIMKELFIDMPSKLATHYMKLAFKHIKDL